jgi:signal transduction histidine kinase
VLLVEEGDLVIETVDGPPGLTRHVGLRMSTDRPVLGDVLRGTGAVVVEDLAELAAGTGQLANVPELEGLGRTVFVPLPPGTRGTAGILMVAGEHGDLPIGDAGTDLIMMFANQTTLALERAADRRDQSALAVLADRDRIARDLHDLVIQRLFATGLQLQGIHRSVTPEVQDRIGRAVTDIDTTIRDLRASIFELQHQPGRRSLRADVRALVDEYTVTLGFAPRLRFTGPIDSVVPALARPQILAAVREALSNVARHARASNVTVDVTVAAGEVTAQVADDGIGIKSTATESGLRNLRERAATLGGTVRLAERQPHGTLLELRSPLDIPAA